MSDAIGRLATALADRYVIERQLGAGGMATVYLAQDVRHDRKVALKVLRPELSAILGGERSGGRLGKILKRLVDGALAARVADGLPSAVSRSLRSPAGRRTLALS